MDLGPPISYLVVEEGTPVLSSDGEEVGRVTHVLADTARDIFEGLVIREGLLDHRFADAEHIAELHERGVLLNLDSREAARLPQPGKGPADRHDERTSGSQTPLGQRLRRAWERISGNP